MIVERDTSYWTQSPSPGQPGSQPRAPGAASGFEIGISGKADASPRTIPSILPSPYEMRERAGGDGALAAAVFLSAQTFVVVLVNDSTASARFIGIIATSIRPWMVEWCGGVQNACSFFEKFSKLFEPFEDSRPGAPEDRDGGKQQLREVVYCVPKPNLGAEMEVSSSWGRWFTITVFRSQTSEQRWRGPSSPSSDHGLNDTMMELLDRGDVAQNGWSFDSATKKFAAFPTWNRWYRSRKQQESKLFLRITKSPSTLLNRTRHQPQQKRNSASHEEPFQFVKPGMALKIDAQSFLDGGTASPA
ncbi:unnamed protein product [Cyprideis torosa]|uniref:Uncharacterized protein n=1 Tax=Cyprideis torosa TaxID=163714 RepID=A0A7R8ZVH5_9CRUS|nr:unnamed protein product [Cyprideis torosa]CAG0903239.1 unnamed protein product [Cyprideis torosa]